MKKVGITVAAAVCVVLLCVGFYFMKNSDGSQTSKENLTVVQRINEKNLTTTSRSRSPDGVATHHS